jgi:hypothetical protein
MSNFLLLQALRDDAGAFASSGHDRIGHDAHEPNAATAIHEPNFIFSEYPGQGYGILLKSGIIPPGRATIDADGTQLVHRL